MRHFVTVALLAVLATTISAQDNFIELRGSTTQYGYIDYTRNLSKNVVGEVTYIRTPGQQQGFIGLGRSIKLGDAGSINTMAYGVIGSNGQSGIMPAVLPNIQKGPFKSSAFFGWFIKLKGNVSNYAVLDSWDTTWALSKKFDAGMSAGFFRQNGKWNSQVGPMIRLNLDKLGSWNMSQRFGPGGRELRFTRTFTF